MVLKLRSLTPLWANLKYYILPLSLSPERRCTAPPRFTVRALPEALVNVLRIGHSDRSSPAQLRIKTRSFSVI